MAKEGAKKILRVGIIQGGRIVEERLIRKREDVSLGTHAKNTFILPSSQLGKSFRLFEAKSDSYLLSFDERMEGRLSVNDEVLDLSSLAKSGNTKKRGGRSQIELDDRSRGKVVIGEFTLLFQFVEKPPVLPRPQLPAAARSRSVDWLMFNVLLMSFLVQAGLGIGLDFWWRTSGQYLHTEFGAKKTRAYELLKAEVMAEKEKEKEEEPEPEPDEEEEENEEAVEEQPEPEPEPKKKVKKQAPKAEPKPAKDPQPQKRSAARIKELKTAVTKKTFLHALGSVGEGDGPGNTLGKGLAAATLDDAFNNLDGGVANADGTTKTFVGQPQAVKSGKGAYKGLGKGEGGGSRIKTGAVKAKTKKRAEIKVKFRVRGGSVGGQSGSGRVDKGAVKKVFSRRSGAIKHCYEKALKTNPNVKGKVTIRFQIGTAGRITRSKCTSNTTGSAAICKCILGKVKSWRFPSPEGGPVTFSYPFILSQG